MITYIRDDDRRRIRVTIADSATLAELIAVVDRQASEGTWQYGMLYDVRALGDPSTAADRETVLNHVRRLITVHGPRGPVAVVARSSATIGTAQMYSHRAGEDLMLQVFWDLDEAERWLEQQ